MILLTFLSRLLWYVLIGFVLCFLFDTFDHDWFHSYELNSCARSGFDYDRYSDLMYLAMYAAYGVIWPICLYRYLQYRFSRKEKKDE